MDEIKIEEKKVLPEKDAGTSESEVRKPRRREKHAAGNVLHHTSGKTSGTVSGNTSRRTSGKTSQMLSEKSQSDETSKTVRRKNNHAVKPDNDVQTEVSSSEVSSQEVPENSSDVRRTDNNRSSKLSLRHNDPARQKKPADKKKSTRKRRRLKSDVLLGAIMAAVLIIGMVLNLAVKDKTTSELENRELAQAPKLSLENITDGVYSDEFEEYQSDQFVGRNALRYAQVFLRWLTGDREENDIYLGKDGQLLEKIVTPDQDLLTGNISAINSYAQANPDVRFSMMMVPDAGTILTDSYPAFAEENHQKEYFSQVQGQLDQSINWIDVITALERHTDEKLYYKTDHHWTTLGALYAYQQYFSVIGRTTGLFTAYTVTDDFNGVLSSNSGFCPAEKETIEIYTPNAGTQQVVNYVDESVKSVTLYDMDKLDTKDQYAVFLGGNHSLVDIKTTTDNTDTILIFKDSFANCFIPFLTDNYSEIVVVDPRYYYGDAQSLISTYGVTDVLFLYSGNTFFEDNNIQGMLGTGTAADDADAAGEAGVDGDVSSISTSGDAGSTNDTGAGSEVSSASDTSAETDVSGASVTE